MRLVYLVRVRCVLILFLFVSTLLAGENVFFAILPQGSFYTLPQYLKHISNLDYEKKKITLYINATQTDSDALQILKEWSATNEPFYKKIIFEQEKSDQIRDLSFKRAKEEGSDYYFVVDTNNFIAPCTLRELILRNKPIIAPLLHAIPHKGDIASNYFCDVTENGYYKDHSDYFSLLHRTIKGTIKVPLVYRTYLVKTTYLNDVKYSEGSEPFSIVFARSARANGIDQYICNDLEFGVFFNGTDEEYPTIAPYIQPQQQQAKKVIYISKGNWGDLFDKENKIYCTESWINLRLALNAAGYELVTVESPNSLHHYEKLIVFDVVPGEAQSFFSYPKERSILFLWEPASINPHNFEKNYHTFFSKVFTWNDDFVDNKKYFKLYHPDAKEMRAEVLPFDQKKFAVMVASNKITDFPNEYSKRIELALYYNQNHPEEFDLFGLGWKGLKISRGTIEGSYRERIETISHYKFCYAYENKEEPGYISEKIFNCFEAGTLPIYWGAPNVSAYIPKNCFICKRDFQTEEDLYAFLKKMTKEEYEKYLSNIREFLKSEAGKKFGIEAFIHNFITMIKE